MPHTVLLAEPRGFCAGVVRAIDALDEILRREPHPVYVLHEIVHNRFVVERFESSGAVFVNSLDEVPANSLAVISAHGAAPDDLARARSRGLRVIDATCPLVTRVHLESAKAARDGYRILLVGHEGHDEVEGTKGVAPGATTVVDTPADVGAVEDGRGPVFVVTQTTLSVEDTAQTVAAIRARFGDVEVRNDICYATTNRQAAVKAIAERADLVIVVGSENSSNTQRLCDVARDLGTPAYRVDGFADIDPAWYEGVEVVGLTSGASAPPELLDAILADLRERGARIEPVVVATESIEFSPAEGLEQRPARDPS